MVEDRLAHGHTCVCLLCMEPLSPVLIVSCHGIPPTHHPYQPMLYHSYLPIPLLSAGLSIHELYPSSHYVCLRKCCIAVPRVLMSIYGITTTYTIHASARNIHSTVKHILIALLSVCLSTHVLYLSHRCVCVCARVMPTTLLSVCLSVSARATPIALMSICTSVHS